MHGNYRHHYLLSAAAPAAASAATSSSAQPTSSSLSSLPNKSLRQQHQQQFAADFNGLPIASKASAKINQSQILPSNYPPLAKQSEFSALQLDQQPESQRFSANRHYIEQQQQLHLRQVRAATVTATTGSREYCTKLQEAAGSIDGRRPKQQQQLIHMNNNNHHHNQMILPKQREYQQPHYDQHLASRGEHETDAALSNGHQTQQHHQDNYASQIRNSQLQHRFQHQQPATSTQMQQHTRGSQLAGPSSQRLLSHSPASSRSSSSPQASATQQPKAAKSPAREEKPLHVNFNRGNHLSGEDEGDSRKKKYLTAKYGQQQMNLIKKRLKIEMWLCEQLQELAKGSKSEAELDEIDVDLEQLLDMDDDDTRRRWLKKTLEPFEDLPGERIDKFISDVLEQSKLL